jgi:hypothetical protein
MALVKPYYTDTDPQDPVYHIYDDCPRGSEVIRDGNAKQGMDNRRLCDFCKNKRATGHF